MTDDEHRVDIFMPLYVRDFLTGTFGWTAEERGHYITLLALQWDQGGLPRDAENLEKLSPGFAAFSDLLFRKFPVSQDGQRRNLRLEQHRERCLNLKKQRVKAAKQAASARYASRRANAEQTQGKRTPNGCHPTPTPNSYPSSLREEGIKHTTHTAGGAGCWPPEAGWEGFAARWNATERAIPWKPAHAPAGWQGLARTPGWLDKAEAALARLPGCEYFDRPLALTRFIEYVDRILAGEFDAQKAESKPRRRQPAGGNL
jgi:uncharacterized protein YdaU (DUF1376 family)